MAFPVHFRTRVQSVERHSKYLCSYTFAPIGRIPRFKPGQFVHLALDAYDPSQHWPESRVFSIASAPSQKVIRLTVGLQGVYTSRIINTLEVGDEVSLKGPYGEFVISAQGLDEHLVLVAGGTGITPFCSYLEELCYKPELATNPVHLFYAVREQRHFIYRDLMEECKKQLRGLFVHYFCEADPGFTDVPKRLSVGLICERLPDIAKTRFYLSGPQAMITNFRTELTAQRGISPDKVHVDAWQ